MRRTVKVGYARPHIQRHWGRWRCVIRIPLGWSPPGRYLARVGHGDTLLGAFNACIGPCGVTMEFPEVSISHAGARVPERNVNCTK